MSMDIDIFSSVIAKELDIRVRFVGEEPKDMVTKQYNDALKRMLPKQGIKLIEIPRKKIEGNIISASTVRTLWHEGDFESLKNYVPESTWRYLKEHDSF